MKDYNDDFNEMNEIPVSDNSSDIGSENIYSAQNNEEVPESVEAQTYEDIAGSSEEPKAAPESSYEWNAAGSEYRISRRMRLRSI